MFVELIEFLRCPRPHDESQLIASAEHTVDRHIVDGVLGCPVCNAEFAIAGGVALFDSPPVLTAFEKPDQEIAMRLAAFLELTDARGFALLCGRWGVHASFIGRMTDTPLVLVNPSIAAPALEAAGALRSRTVPFAAGSARALALDEIATPDIVASGVRAVKAGGRVLGPASIAIPDGVTEIVRDDRVWVGEKNAAPDRAPRLVSISRSKS